MGQKNKIARRWAKRGTRPSAPKDQRTASAYIFGAICPKVGKGAALVMPKGDIEAMTLHLAEIATQIAPGAQAALLVDQAAWRLSGRLVVPPNIPLIPLPSKCPELAPQENVWQFMRDNWLSNRIFKTFNDIVDHCCDAWNKLIDQPWRIMSLGLRDWAYRSYESWYKRRCREEISRWPDGGNAPILDSSYGVPSRSDRSLSAESGKKRRSSRVCKKRNACLIARRRRFRP